MTPPQVGYTIGLEELVATPSTVATTLYTVEYPGGDGMVRTTTTPAGVTHETVEASDGTRTTTYADGTTLAVKKGPDPRFALQAALPASVTLTTGGHNLTVETKREVVLADPN